MRSYLFLMFVCFIVHAQYGQITVTNTTFPKIGDTLKTAANFNFSGTLNMGSVGGPQTWNFSVLNEGSIQEDYYVSPSEGNDSNSFPDANLLIKSGGQEQYIKTTATKMEGLGFGGENQFLPTPVVVRFSKRPTIRTAPLTFIGTTSSDGEFRIDLGSNIIPDTLLAGLPFKPDSIRIQFANSSRGILDAYGTLKIQGKEFQVLREKSDNITETKLFIKILGLWIDPLPLIGGNIPGGFGAFLGKDTTITYNFYSNVKKEIIVSADYSTSNELQSVSFVNLGSVVSSTTEIKSASISVYPNPSDDVIHLTSSAWNGGPYFITVADISGKIVYFETTKLNSGETKDLNISSLNQGQYVLTIRDKYNIASSNVKFLVR